MFWNSDFIASSPSSVDLVLQIQDVQLSDIIFEEELLTEMKTSNSNLINFLNKPEVISELVNNIAKLTDKDCCDKLVFSSVHIAYISCEILTSGSTEIFSTLINQPECLSKILNCLVEKPSAKTIATSTIVPVTITKENDDNREGQDDGEKKEEETTKEVKETEKENSALKDDKDDDSKTTNFEFMTTIVPQKATLVSKLINTIHSTAAANLSCHITQDIESFSRLINLLINNIEISGSFEILGILMKRTNPSELRYAFCEILSKLNFAHRLIDVMTLSNIDDKQRNACQLLCDIIVIGRQEASEQPNDSGPMAQDMLAEFLESSQAVHIMLNQMFPNDDKDNDNNDDDDDKNEDGSNPKRQTNSTAIICGMKVLQTLIESKQPNSSSMIKKTIEQTQEEIEKHLIKFHELLLNPPKQEPIKTTFGIIQKPLGYMRLEVVNLIRALISTNSPNIIKKLVELKTMKVVVDLFIDYCWNNLLHTQVEQALCLIINNYRRDEEVNYYEPGMNDQQSAIEIPSKALLSQLLNECDLIGRLLNPNSYSMTNIIEELPKKNQLPEDEVSRNGEQANYGHIIQMINSLAINRDLDCIKDHLNEMKENKPDLYDIWTKFVSIDVASFKEISLYYDAQSNNSFNQKFGHKIQPQNNHIITIQKLNSIRPPRGPIDEDFDLLVGYYHFEKEIVIPSINVDVIPRLRHVNNP